MANARNGICMLRRTLFAAIVFVSVSGCGDRSVGSVKFPPEGRERAVHCFLVLTLLEGSGTFGAILRLDVQDYGPAQKAAATRVIAAGAAKEVIFDFSGQQYEKKKKEFENANGVLMTQELSRHGRLCIDHLSDAQ